MRSRQAIQESGRNNREVGTTGAPWLLLIKSGVVVMRAVDAADHPPTFTHMPMSGYSGDQARDGLTRYVAWTVC